MQAEPGVVALGDIKKPSSFQVLTGLNGNVISNSMEDENNEKQILARTFREKMKLQQRENIYDFLINTTAHNLYSCKLVQKLPLIRIKQEHINKYRIRLSPNPGHSVIMEAVVTKANRQLQAPITGETLDLHMQFIIPKNERDDYRRKIGAVKELTEWTTELNPYTLHVPLPFAYTRSRSKSLKLVIMDNLINEPVIHSITVRNKISDLVCIEEKQLDESWLPIDSANIYNIATIVGVNADSLLPAPELWGTYEIMTQEEINQWNLESSRGYDIFIDEFVPIEDVKQNGNKSTANINSDNLCGKAILWVAVNNNAQERNNFSNYSTNSTKASEGSDPIASSTFFRRDKNEWINLPSDHNNIGLDATCVSYPDEPGYHCHCWCQNLRETGLDNTISFDTASRLTITMSPNINPADYTIKVWVASLRVYRYYLGKFETMTIDEYSSSSNRLKEDFRKTML